jgi:hypothetical protein
MRDIKEKMPAGKGGHFNTLRNNGDEIIFSPCRLSWEPPPL